MNNSLTYPQFLFLGLISLAILQSCGILVSYINTSDTRDNITRSKSAMDQNYATIHAQNNLHSSLFLQLSNKNISLINKPFPKLRNLHNSNLEDEKKLILKQTKIENMAIAFKPIINGKSKISDKDPEWDQVTHFYDSYEKEYDEIIQNAKDLQSRQGDFMDLTKKHDIYLTKVTEIQKIMKNYHNTLSTRSSEIKGTMLEIKNNTRLKFTKDLNNEQINKIKGIKNQINEFSLYLSNIQKRNEGIFSTINKEISGLTYVWLTPEMNIRKQFSKIKTDNENLNQRVKKLRDTLKSI